MFRVHHRDNKDKLYTVYATTYNTAPFSPSDRMFLIWDDRWMWVDIFDYVPVDSLTQ